MKGSIVGFIMALFVAALLAPMVVLVEFHMHRAAIAKELCVQRDVVEAMRTCHGECQLSKRFRAMEQESTAEFPTERIQLRVEPQVPVGEGPAAFVREGTDRSFPELDQRIRTGHAPVEEPVPWA